MQWPQDTKGVFRNIKSLKIRQCNGHTIPKRYSETLITKGQTMQWPQDTKGVFRNVNHYRPDNAMATIYQRGIQKRKSLKTRQCNGHKIPKGY